MKPTVSVLCITYNQAAYIKETLDGFFMQQSKFEIEVLLHDDASTDGTIGILKDYERRYPNLHVTYEAKNQYSQGNYTFINRLFEQAKGTYIAFCEGDDFWSDPTKLQRQVDYLEKRPDYAFCFHPVRVFFENNEEPEFVSPDKQAGTTFSLKQLLRGNFIYTNSVLYRAQAYKDKLTEDVVMPQDWYLHLYHAQFGKIGYINRVMATYRRHAGGVWWDAYKDLDKIWLQHGIAHLALYVELLKLYPQAEYQAIILQAIYRLFDDFVNVDTKYNEQLLQRAVDAFPQQSAFFAVAEARRAHDLQVQATTTTAALEVLEQALGSEKALSAQAQQALSDIHASRLWKARNLLRGNHKKKRN